MTEKMLWTLVVPVAALISTLTLLVGAYTYVVWQSDQVSYDGMLGKFTAQASTLKNQLDKALETNNELSTTIDKLKKSLNELKKICKLPIQQGLTSNKENILSVKFMDINNSLKYQSDLLEQQKTKLEAVNKGIIQFKDALKIHSNK